MFVIYFTLIISGILSVSFTNCQAPGNITINMKHQSEDLLNVNNVTLNSTIKTIKGNQVVYQKLDQMKLTKDELELTITFFLNNISEALEYKGSMTINRIDGKEIHEFRSKEVKYTFKNAVLQNNIYYLSKSFYSNEYKNLEILMSAKCKKNYYPEYNCSIFCIKKTKLEKCDYNGTKICNKGFYLNPNSQTCNIDWCKNSNQTCRNEGRCINLEKGFECNCSPTYTGQLCEMYLDLCQNNKCPNETYCSVQIDKVSCEILDTKKSISTAGSKVFQIMSMHTTISMFGFILVFIVTIVFTIWACKTSKIKKYRSVDMSIHSNHTYYPNNSLSKASKYCFHCDQENLPSLNLYHSIYGNRAFYSLKNPANRLKAPINRAFSDIILSYNDRRLSMNSISVPEELLPLPPPLEYERDNENIML